MSVQLFADESQAHGFLLAAATVPCSEVDRVRAKVKTLKLPRQQRLHFHTESDARRRFILGELLQIGVSAVIYDATAHDDQKAARAAAVTRLAQDAAKNGAVRLVLERHVAAESDRRLIRAQLVEAGCHDRVSYCHAEARHECLLGIADAVAWCFAKNGTWRRRVSPMIAEVVGV